MLNNKGQSLVLFILMIPILLGIMALVIDVGNALYQKNEMNNTIEFIIDYGLEEDIETNLSVLLDYNLKDHENTITIENDKIIISSKTYVEGIFSNILNIEGFLIESNYQGYMDGTKKIIEKIK